MKAFVVLSVALATALSLAACGSSEEPEEPVSEAPASPPPASPAAGHACRTTGNAVLRVHGVGCSEARRIVRGFAAEGGSPGALLTVGYFVCQEHGRRLSCDRGTAGIVYTAARP